MTYGSRGRPLAVGPAEEQDSFARACQKRWQRFEVTMFEPNPVSEMTILGNERRDSKSSWLCGRCLKGRPRQIRGETRRGCWRWTSLRRASQAYRPFLLGWLPGTLKAADGGFEDCKRNAFSFTEGSRKLQQQSVVAVLTPPSIAEVLAACTLPLAACCYWLPLNVRVAA